MNFVIWMLAGFALGWFAFSALRMSEGRGRLASLVIGTIGGLIGGKEIAPVFTINEAVASDFSLTALFFAAAVASALLALGHFVYYQWDV